MISSAIFDVDGTLLDSMTVWDTIAEDYLLSLRIEPKENLTEVFKTFSLEQSAQYYQDHYNVKKSVPEIIEDINKLISDFYFYKAPLKSGVKDFLNELKKHSIPMCIATATELNLIEAALSRCGIRDYFTEILTCSDVGKSKNEPDIYRVAMEHLETEKSGTFVFEDAFHAARTAKNDGFKVVGVYDRSESEKSSLQEISDIYIESFNELVPFNENMFL